MPNKDDESNRLLPNQSCRTPAEKRPNVFMRAMNAMASYVPQEVRDLDRQRTLREREEKARKREMAQEKAASLKIYYSSASGSGKSSLTETIRFLPPNNSDMWNKLELQKNDAKYKDLWTSKDSKKKDEKDVRETDFMTDHSTYNKYCNGPYGNNNNDKRDDGFGGGGSGCGIGGGGRSGGSALWMR